MSGDDSGNQDEWFDVHNTDMQSDRGPTWVANSVVVACTQIVSAFWPRLLRRLLNQSLSMGTRMEQ